MSNKKSGILVGLAASAAALAAGVAGFSAVGTASADSGPTPPKGARATVQVSPNPVVKRGQEVTITGNCGGGSNLRAVVGGSPENNILENLRILDDDPNGFLAKATVAERVGAGVGPVLVDCGDEAGVVLLVTRPG